MPLISIQDSFRSTLKEIDERFKQGGTHLIGVPSGIDILDKALGGFRQDSLYTIAGPTGSGKSSLALTLALYQARHRFKAVYVSLEMDGRLLSLRLLSSMTKIPALKIEYGQMTHEENQLVQAQQETIAEWTFHIFDSPLALRDLYLTIKNIYETIGIEILYLDQISLVNNFANREGQTQRIAEVVMTMSALCREIHIPIVALAQLNRDIDNRPGNRPKLSDLKDSGRIAEDSMAVIFVHRPQVWLRLAGQGDEQRDQKGVLVERDAELIIAKNRQGPDGSLPILFYPEEMRWADPSTEQVTTTPPPSLSGKLENRVKADRRGKN